MKKEYIKPDLYYEDFTLSYSVAKGCDATGIAVVEDNRDIKAFMTGYHDEYRNYTCEYSGAELAEYWGSGYSLFLS